MAAAIYCGCLLCLIRIPHHDIDMDPVCTGLYHVLHLQRQFKMTCGDEEVLKLDYGKPWTACCNVYLELLMKVREVDFDPPAGLVSQSLH